MHTDLKPHAVLTMCTVALLGPVLAAAPARRDRRDDGIPPRPLYVGAAAQGRLARACLAVIDFEEDSPRYGRVIRTVPVPGPAGSENEPHHCHLSADKNILACGGLLA